MRICESLGRVRLALARTATPLRVALSSLVALSVQVGLAASVYFGAGTTPATAQAGVCDSSMWLVQYGTLYSVSTASNPFKFTAVGGPAPNNYNGADYNPADNYIYAMNFAGGKTNHLMKVSTSGGTVELGAVTGLPTAGNYRSAAFSPAGNILYVVGANTPNILRRINVSTMTATSVTMTASIDIADLAWVGTRLYAVERSGQLVSIDPTGGTVTKIGAISEPTGYFGAMFGAPNGLFGSHNSGGFYQFDLTTGERTLLSDSPPADSNDGMHCPSANLAFGAEISVTKTDGSATYTPGAKTVYTIEVANAGPFGAHGVTVSDPLPAGIPAGAASWTCSGTGGAACSASGTGAILDNANLPMGGKAIYKLTFDVPASFTGPLTNTVTITPPNTVLGDDPANNVASDTDVSVPLLTLRKDVINDHGGTRTPADFVLTAGGPTPISGIHGSAPVTSAPVQSGTYTLSETGPKGYTASDYVCSIDGGPQVTGNTITLGNEQAAICTVVNRDQPASLTLSKIVRNDHGGTATPADFTLSAAGPTPISGVSGNAAVTNATVHAGVYTLSETNLPGYSAGAYSCVVNGGASASGNSLTLGPGDAAVCTVTNTDQPARLTLVKNLVNDHGGPAKLADFTLTATGPTSVSGISGTANVTAASISAGTYQLGETNLPGYTASDYSCVVNGGAPVVGNTLPIANGDAAVCTVTNTAQPARLTLVKTVVNSHGGTAVARQLHADGDGADRHFRRDRNRRRDRRAGFRRQLCAARDQPSGLCRRRLFLQHQRRRCRFRQQPDARQRRPGRLHHLQPGHAGNADAGQGRQQQSRRHSRCRRLRADGNRAGLDLGTDWHARGDGGRGSRRQV